MTPRPIFHVLPFETIAEASAYHVSPSERWVQAAYSEYRVDRATSDENSGVESERVDSINRRNPLLRRLS